jgi:predicted nucleotidyltransferase
MDSDKISEPLLQTIVQRLLAADHPQKIILFGSQARGQAGRDSDYDLLVIEDSSQARYRRAVSYRRALKDLGISKDIVIWTPRESAEWQNVSNTNQKGVSLRTRAYKSRGHTKKYMKGEKRVNHSGRSDRSL